MFVHAPAFEALCVCGCVRVCVYMWVGVGVCESVWVCKSPHSILTYCITDHHLCIQCAAQSVECDK